MTPPGQSDTIVCRGPGCYRHVRVAITGRPRRFCSEACKQRAFRARRGTRHRARFALRNAPVALDLYCCEGGAGAGLRAAGFEVVGVDLVDQPRYPFTFHRGHALELLQALVERYAPAFVHASPPCQVHSSTRNFFIGQERPQHVDLIPDTRAALDRLGIPYMIENVLGAPLVDPVLLCGAMFGLGTYRHRLFELGGWTVERPPHPRHHARACKMGYAPTSDRQMHTICGNFKDTPRAREAMGIGWMSRKGLAQSIPPAYTRWLGERFLEQMPAAAQVA